ncbi:uncharacterized protein LOC120438241 [Oreochromis aureus]|uniref:uncharacterized protein LOC120438241 n=1 Tax=Oreochromis aureus TaxID=47969 RepID=UPI0019547ACF|nr:uncharacterized protein LOC120438241 [Oreochromis aureus]CAI5671426.1 unnamed protein product [Mustela putorius furo]
MKLISIIYLRVGPPKGRGVDPVFFNTVDSAAEVPDSQQDPLTGTDHKIITVESGQDVTLTCRAQAHIVIVVEWSRTDLEDEELVLLYQHGRLVPDYQHPSFENRVDLKDRQIADGDVSLILKNVRQDDAGTYECRVIQRAGKPLKLISIINLRVGSPTGRGSFNTVDDAAEIPDSKQDTLPGPVNNTSPPATDICWCASVFSFSKPAYEMKETNPDWVPTLHTGHYEIPASNYILHTTMPIRLLLPCVGKKVTLLDKMAKVCCVLVNMCPSVVVKPGKNALVKYS